MKNIVILMALLGATQCFALNYVPTDATLDLFTEDAYYAVNGGVVDSVSTAGLGIGVAAHTDATSGWWATAVSLEYLYPNGLDLTGYDNYTVTVTNGGSGYMFANTHINAGWVDYPGDQHIQDGDEWIAPGQSVVINLDLSQLPAGYSEMVTRTAIQIGGYASSPGWDFDGVSPVSTEIQAVVTPEPTTVSLLALGVLGLIRRKR